MPRCRDAAAALAQTLDLARLSLAVGEGAPLPLAERRPPLVTLGALSLVPPAGGFLQPTRDGEEPPAEAAAPAPSVAACVDATMLERLDWLQASHAELLEAVRTLSTASGKP